MTKTVAIITPSYNRATTLPKLFDSLIKQDSFDFVWYVIDDGSEDNTASVIKAFENNRFDLKYIKKNNGGKHTALNVGIEIIEEPLVFIVDSDDYLTSDAISTITTDWKKYMHDSSICGMSYYRLYDDGQVIGSEYAKDRFVDSYANVRINERVLGDKAEVWRTDILKKYKFPEFSGEKFLSEAVVWNAIASDGYLLAYIAKGIYVCEYLEGGLSKSGKGLRLKNPLGTLKHASSFWYEKIALKIRIKYLLYYTAVSIYSNNIRYAVSHCKKGYKIGYIFSFIPCSLLACYWRVKYK